VSPLFYDQDELRSARAQILLQGHDTIESWAEANGFSVSLVQNVLTGRRRCIRGKSAAIARKLGLPPTSRDGSPCRPFLLRDKAVFTGACSDAAA